MKKTVLFILLVFVLVCVGKNKEAFFQEKSSWKGDWKGGFSQQNTSVLVRGYNQEGKCVSFFLPPIKSPTFYRKCKIFLLPPLLSAFLEEKQEMLLQLQKELEKLQRKEKNEAFNEKEDGG